MSRVTVNGLNMSVEMWTRVITAVRGLYPELTGDDVGGTPLSDAGAVQAVMLSVLTDWVALYESQVQAPDPSEAAQQAIAAAIQARADAEATARTDIAGDITPTVTT
jgi:hypothetical protein